MSDFDGIIFTVKNTSIKTVNLQNILLKHKDKIIKLMGLDGEELYFMIDDIDGYIEIDPDSEEVPEELQKKALDKYFNDLLSDNLASIDIELEPESKYLILIMKNSAGWHEIIEVLKLIEDGGKNSIKFEIAVDEDDESTLSFELPS